jgi:hypothetical protein
MRWPPIISITIITPLIIAVISSKGAGGLSPATGGAAQGCGRAGRHLLVILKAQQYHYYISGSSMEYS